MIRIKISSDEDFNKQHTDLIPRAIRQEYRQLLSEAWSIRPSVVT